MTVPETSLQRFILVLTLILVNWRAVAPAIVRVADERWGGVAGTELLVILCLAVLIVLLLYRAGALGGFLRSWRNNLVLAVFGVFALLSVLWSVSPLASLYKWGVFALATLVGSYLGFRLRARGVLHALFWYGAFLAVASLLLAVVVPSIGRMYFGYDGAWRGIFWHRNHLGTLMALCSLVSGYHLDGTRRLGPRKALPVLMILLLQVYLVQMTRSATGLLVLLAGGGLFALAFLWHRTRHKLRRPYYLVALGTAGTALAILGLRIREVLALLGRNAALSGRIPLWQHVLAEYVSERPILGYGLGAFWDSLTHRVATAQAIGSRLRIEIGDNGWLDVLLGVGGVGLALFLLVQVVMLQRSIQRIIRGRSSADSLPLTFLLAALFANLAFSLFLETESGVWLMLVALHFLPAPSDEIPHGSSQATQDTGQGFALS